MRFLVTLLVALLFCATGSTALAQGESKSRPSLMGSNSEGFHFMVGFMQNEIDDGWCSYQPARLLIAVASRFDARVKVKFQEGSTVDTLVKAFTVVQIQVPSYYEMIGENVFEYGIEITADRPVTVTCYNGKDQTSDGYLALPTTSWGTQYLSACYYVDQYEPRPDDVMDCWAVPRRGEFAVIAAEDSTVVNVYPSTTTVEGVRTGQLYRRILQKGQIFQVQDGGDTKRSPWFPGTDLTGSVITASKPVGLLSGHVRSGVPNNFDSKDHLVEMLPPRNTLGKRYMIVPFGGRTGGDVVRLTSTVGMLTNVTITSAAKGVYTGRLPSTGQFLDYDIVDPILITADQPILVTHYSRSQEAGRGGDSLLRSNFDPDMVVVTPEEQFVNGAIFQTLSNDTAWRWNGNAYVLTTKFQHHYVTIIGERSKFDLTKLNGKVIGLHTALGRGDIPSTQFSWAVIEVPHNTTHIIESEGLFGGYVYGVGNVDSYAWPIGSGLRQFDVVDDDPPTIVTRPVCGASEVISLDSGRTQLGLANVWLDDALSTNALFEKTFVVRGDELSLGYVRAKDPRQPAFARVWAEDLAGLRTYTDVTLALSAPTFSGDSITFGNMSVGETASRSFTITNDGAAPMLVETAYLVRGLDYQLERDYRNITIGPDGGQLTLKVFFRTDYKLTRYDTLVVVVDCQVYRFPMVAYLASPRIGTHDVPFGRVRLGRERTLPLRVYNSGDATLRIDSAVIDGATFSKTNELVWPIEIEPGADTVAMRVVFRPTSTAAFTGTVRFYSNADSVAIAQLSGTGIYPTLSIKGFDFGRIQIGDTACTTIPIANIGSDTAFLTGLDLPDPDAFLPDAKDFPRALADGDTMWVRVCFAPTAERRYVTNVSPRNDDDLTAIDSLLGIGFRPRATLGGADMGRLWIGEGRDSVVYVTNVGTDEITITRVWLEGGDAGDFLVEPLLQERTLAPNERMPVNVHFRPLLPGHREAYIHAETASRHQPQLDSVLLGFGLFALSRDTLEFDDALAYACDDREGRIVIANDGNTPLTIASIGFTAVPPVMTLNAPDPGYTIPVGESLALDFSLAFAGFTGVTRGTVSWSFEEPPNAPMRREFTREFSIATAPQRYDVSAVAPALVSAGEVFELSVRVDTAVWTDVAERELAVVVEFDPSMILFDAEAWGTATSIGSPWQRGAATIVEPGRIELQYLSAAGVPLPISGVTLPGVPFKAFIGRSERDSLRVTMTAVGNTCATPAVAAAGVALDSICGLSVRLFEYTGSPFILRQNRPNPVKERTEILFTVSMEAPTRLELFAADGRLVRVLVDAVLIAGDYTIPVDVHEMPSGPYYYRLTSGSFSAMRQMQVSQ
jgi:hypothetical protein